MRSRNLLLSTLLGIGLSTLVVPTALAQTVIQQVDTNTLRIIEYKGKPPFKRTTITEASNPAAYARYAGMIDYDPKPLFAIDRRGAPGKSLPRQARRVSGDTQEVAEFARFEETDNADSRGNGRRWRGPPGKSRTMGR